MLAASDDTPATHVLVLHGGDQGNLYDELRTWARGDGRGFNLEIYDGTDEVDLFYGKIRDEKPDCIVFDATAKNLRKEINEKVVRAWRRNARDSNYPGPGVVAVYEPGNPADVAWLRSIGVEEVYERPANRAGIVSQIQQAISVREALNADKVVTREIHVPVGAQRIQANTIIFAGIGGSGKTTGATNTAAVLQFPGRYRTCLVDMAGTNPAVHHFLGIENDGRHGLSSIIMSLRPEGEGISRDNDVIDENVLSWKPGHFPTDQELDLILGYHSYPAIIDQVEHRWTQALMRKLVRLLRLPHAYTIVVIDLGAGLYHAGETGALAESDLILIMMPVRRGAAEATGQYVHDLFEILNLDPENPQRPVGVVLNGVGQDGALNERKVRQLLPPGVEVWGGLPWAPLEVENALADNSLPVLAEPDCLFSKAITSLVHSHIAPLPQEAPAGKGLLKFLRRSA